LAFDPFHGALLEDALKEHALVGDVLVDNPESFVIYRKYERLSNLTQRFERSERRHKIAGRLRCEWQRRHAAVSSNRLRWNACKSHPGIGLDGARHVAQV